MNNTTKIPSSSEGDIEAYEELQAGGRFATLQAPNVVPEAFKGDWERKMDKWGGQMLRAVDDVNEALGLGLGLEKGALTKLAKCVLASKTASRQTIDVDLQGGLASFSADIV